MPGRPLLRIACAMALATMMSGCNDESREETPRQTVGNATLAAALAESEDAAVMSEALKETGLAQVFDGSAAYTVLAPSNEALAAIDQNSGLLEEDRKALLAAVLREHVLPGALTPDDIRKAIAVQKGDVSIRTVGEGIMRFSVAGDRLTVTNENGDSAEVVGSPILASNGVVISIDSVLKRP